MFLLWKDLTLCSDAKYVIVLWFYECSHDWSSHKCLFKCANSVSWKQNIPISVKLKSNSQLMKQLWKKWFSSMRVPRLRLSPGSNTSIQRTRHTKAASFHVNTRFIAKCATVSNRFMDTWQQWKPLSLQTKWAEITCLAFASPCEILHMVLFV